MQNDYIEMIEPTPKLRSKKCKYLALALEYFLKYTLYVVTLLIWYSYDYFIAGAIFLLTFIIMGIVRAKLRNSSIPLKQQEYSYNDKGIATWYVAKNVCFEESEANLT